MKRAALIATAIAFIALFVMNANRTDPRLDRLKAQHEECRKSATDRRLDPDRECLSVREMSEIEP